MEKLTKSPRLNYLLGQMGIFTYYDVINHLPHRYDDYSYTDETNIQDKQRVVLLGKVISVPRVVPSRSVTVLTFDFMSRNRKYYKIVFFNQPYLAKTVKIDEEYSIIGTFNLKRNEVDGMKMIKGEVPLEERLKPVYSLPRDFQNYLFANLAEKSLKQLEGKIFSLVPYDYLKKYRLVNKEQAYGILSHIGKKSLDS
jgi:ATP-dependent DNA helicase RecG